jgi:hypothetical protein
VSTAIAKAMAGSAAVVAAEPIFADDDLAAYCPDLDQWPTSWMYEQRDLSPGRQMVECFKPFLRHLMSLGLSRKTLRRHRDNLWLLGGELVRDLHATPRPRQPPIGQVVREALNDEGGPLICHGAGEDQQRCFDATCRKFYRFLDERNRSSTTYRSSTTGRWTCGQR